MLVLKQKSYVRFLWLCIFRPNYVVATKIKPNFFLNARHTKTGNHLDLSSIPKELSNLMLLQLFSLLQRNKLSNRGIFTSNGGQERQKMQKHHFNTKPALKLLNEQNSSSKSLI